MRRAGLLAVAAVMAGALAGCGSSGSDDGASSPVAYGAQTCSDWAVHLSDSERWDAASTLLVNAKALDGAKGDRTPSTGTVKQFEADVSAYCDKGSSDDLLASVADDVYEANAAYYSS
ncbi:hypothetical protein AB0E08_08235 [Streptomyces sp. NPDC048281]|uniref:hypothetical protein n=1 Tax=Streptomyces sp. NPDC048281 TaxID=3154715 RepID=UPI00342C1430